MRAFDLRLNRPRLRKLTAGWHAALLQETSDLLDLFKGFKAAALMKASSQTLGQNTHPMNADTAARIFHDWAAGEGLLSGTPAADTTSTAAEFARIASITDAGKQLLRAKQIQAVAFNEPRREIIVFTRRAMPVSKKALKALPQTVDDVDVRYRQGAQEQIGETPPQPFGAPPYVVRQSGGSGRYTCGSSVSVGNARDAGTLGCLVRNADQPMARRFASRRSERLVGSGKGS